MSPAYSAVNKTALFVARCWVLMKSKETNPAQLSNRQQQVIYGEMLEPTKSQKQQKKLQQQQTPQISNQQDNNVFCGEMVEDYEISGTNNSVRDSITEPKVVAPFPLLSLSSLSLCPCPEAHRPPWLVYALYSLSVSKKFQIHEKELQKSLSVLEFLKAHDFNETQIGRLIEKWPRVLLCRVESTLKLKFDFLTQNGFAGQILPQLIVLVPAILNRKVDSCIRPCFEFLKSFLDNNEKLLAAIKRYPWYLTFNFNSALKPNTVFLIKEGVPHDRVAKLILMYPRALQMKPDRMVRVVNSVKNLGLEPKAPVFVHALRVMIGMSESTWKRKIEYMKSLGWTEDEVLLTFKRNPDILACSEEKIGRAMDFFVNTVRLGSQTVVANPVLLQYSIDKRVRPRYNVLKVLESKNLIEVNRRVFWLLTTRSEMKFRENYVAKYADKVPGLLEIYRGFKSSAGLQSSAGQVLDRRKPEDVLPFSVLDINENRLFSLETIGLINLSRKLIQLNIEGVNPG
ncbi:hypothetical protein POTOM_003841 [Populus tomentosa]|uniref:Mitochondrial transcription termination factor family protein n=1 Tax=Populus tomentosa TaxID=118781 RepID=A0A8X8AJ59_POPTO|nr:hypothetical protein POTOM_003841 [Populus tomentosa]